MKRLFLIIILLSASLISDTFTPSHYCSKPSKPYKPYSFSSQWELDNYKNDMESFYNDVETYKSCIKDFVEEQNDAVRKHNNAAEDAINEWNSFVNYELN